MFDFDNDFHGEERTLLGIAAEANATVRVHPLLPLLPAVWKRLEDKSYKD